MGKLRGSPEKELQRSILEWLKVKYPQIKAWKVNSTGTFSLQKKTFLKPDKYTMKGVSDICGIFPNGTWLAIEVKIKPGKPTEEQVAFLKMIEGNGGVGMWVYTIEEVEAFLSKVIKSEPNLLRMMGQPLLGLEDQIPLLRDEMS